MWLNWQTINFGGIHFVPKFLYIVTFFIIHAFIEIGNLSKVYELFVNHNKIFGEILNVMAIRAKCRYEFLLQFRLLFLFCCTAGQQGKVNWPFSIIYSCICKNIWSYRAIFFFSVTTLNISENEPKIKKYIYSRVHF